MDEYYRELYHELSALQHAAAQLEPRGTPLNCEKGGVAIQKGTRVLISLWYPPEH